MSINTIDIQPKGPISELCLAAGLNTFGSVALAVSKLPYARNSSTQDPLIVWKEMQGTCSTKHAFLKRLADENEIQELSLWLGIFKMNAANTLAIAGTLHQHGLTYIPEAHCYLRFENQVLDFTKYNVNPIDFLNDLIDEKEINVTQIGPEKVQFHREFITKWLAGQSAITYTAEEVWRIREQCIQDLSNEV